jgi:hypothetical protein
MPFDWHGFLDLARSLQQQAKGAPNSEAYLRSAISRAYFGAFGHARNYAKRFLDFAARDDPDDHGKLRAHLKRKRRAADATRLDQLRQWRNSADYEDDLSAMDLSATLAAAISQAQRVFDSLIPPKAK